MPVVYKEIELHEVVKLLRQKGYGEDASRNYALRLNMATTERYKTSGAYKRVPIGGVTKAQLTQILRLSSDAEEAAAKVEAICLGKEMLPIEANGMPSQEPGLDLVTAERLITNRVANEVQKHLEPVNAMQQQLVAMLGGLKDMIASLPQQSAAPAGKKRGRPKGSKNKPKDAQQAAEEPIPPPPPIPADGKYDTNW